jgi:chemotaxis-related protein WspB
MLALVFQIGSHRFACDARRVKEVVPRVHLQTMACSPSWLAGVFVYRGRIVPVIDLHRLIGAGECPPHLSSRIILVPYPVADSGSLVGLLAAHVNDLCDLTPHSEPTPHLGLDGGPDLGPVLADGQGVLRLLDLDRLLPETARSQLLALPREGP